MATMYNRNGYYYISYCINGKRVRRSIGQDEEEAKIYLKEIEYRLFRGDLKPDKPKMPIDYVITGYLRNCKSRLAPSTHIRYQSAIQHFKNFLIFLKNNYMNILTKNKLTQLGAYALDKCFNG